MASPAAKIAWYGAVASGVLTLLGMPLDFLSAREVPGLPIWPFLLSMGVALSLLAFLAASRRNPTVHFGSFAFLVNNAFIVLALWVSSCHLAVMAPAWVPFQEHKLAVLAVALLAPAEVWVGVVTIALYSGSALLKYAGFDAATRHRLPIGEPWATLAFTVFALALLAYRIRRIAVEQALVQANAEAALLEGMARRLLALKDMANTPLQTLEADAAALAELPESRLHAQRIRRSLDRLREWHGMLVEEESTIDVWADGHESFDARRLLGNGDAAATPRSPPHRHRS
jgi:hypothetical protein